MKLEDGRLDGCTIDEGRLVGTYLHGIFDNDEFRRYILNNVREQKKIKPLPVEKSFIIDKEISKLADILRRSLEIDKIYKIMGL